MSGPWLLQCRPGFEAECLEEILALSGGGGETLSGAVSVRTERRPPPLAELVFARQAFQQAADLQGLPPGDRINPILAALAPHAGPVSAVLLENPDTNDGKELAAFFRRFETPLRSALAKNGMPVRRDATRRLHLLFTDSRRVRIGFSEDGTGSPLPNGILRLKLPRAAPSRSTLKLEEALQVFLDERQRERCLRPGLTAVDLGAAPGGWTWQMTQRGLKVIAVDNGPMQRELLDSGLVEHRREDGFRYRPARAVDWLLCDMVEQPQRIAELVTDWCLRGDCRRAVFNLKLPMKKRYPCVRDCLESLGAQLRQAGVDHELRCKQLYHDREEVTAFITLR